MKTCERCSAYMDDACVMCTGVEYSLDQAHRLLDRVLIKRMYGSAIEEDSWKQIDHDVEVWLRVAGPAR